MNGLKLSPLETHHAARLSGLAATLGAFALDQATKLLALAELRPGDVYAVLPNASTRASPSAYLPRRSRIGRTCWPGLLSP